MKILFIGDYSNLHATLARELAGRGHDVTLVSDGCNHMKVGCDILLERRPGMAGSLRYLLDIAKAFPKLRGYDVVQFVNPHFFKLRPGKLRWLTTRLRRDNGGLFLSLAGDDGLFVRRCLDGETFRYSEFRIGDRPTPYSLAHPEREQGYTSQAVTEYTDFFYDTIDGGMAVLPEYYIAARDTLGDRLCHTNLPVDLQELQSGAMDISGRIRVLVGMRSGYEISKGTDRLLAIARKAESLTDGRLETVNVRDLPWSRYREVLASCHINLDQLYSYSPAMNALSTMALGRVAASGAQPEYYDIIGERELRPVISLSPLDEESILDQLIRYASVPELLLAKGEESRRLVERHNAATLVATRYEAHWHRILH